MRFLFILLLLNSNWIQTQQIEPPVNSNYLIENRMLKSVRVSNFEKMKMVGAQGQFYDPKITGFIDLPSGDRLNYNVEFEPTVWNYMFGLYTPLSDHWELAVQTGFRDRQSLTVFFGYRFLNKVGDHIVMVRPPSGVNVVPVI